VFPADQPLITLRTEDFSAQFIQFYNAANQPDVDEARRWALWNQYYGFATVPPGDAGRNMAREMLKQVWPQYQKAIDRIVTGYGGMRPSPEGQVRAVADLLELDKPLKLVIFAYVGMFEGNAFTAENNGEVTVALPIEDAPEHRAIAAAHELTHAVHIALGPLRGSGRPLAMLALAEGLAAHVSKALVPGGREERYVEFTPGWLAQARAHEADILNGIRPFLSATDGETVFRFTLAKGPAGLEREAYYAGWRVVGQWLAEGHTFAQIARIPPDKAAAEFDAAILRLLNKGH